MRRMRILQGMALLLAAMMALCGSGAVCEDILYTENSLNFVEESMDISGGIPDYAEGVLRKIREAGVLRVGTEPYFPPQEFIDPALEGQDQYVGADMEMARLIAERMGVRLEIIPMEFSHVLEAVAEDECDLVISALSFTPSRAATNEMSKGYYFTGEMSGSGILIRQEDAENIQTVDDLADRILVAQSVSVQESLAAENILYYQEFRRLPSTQGVYEAVRTGQADAACVDLTTGSAYVQEHPEEKLMMVDGIRFLLDKEFEGDRIAGKKGELQLIYFVNGVIDEIIQKDLYHQWLEAAQARAEELGVQ